MKVTFLSAKGYGNPCKNYGDCILIDSGSDIVIYDCGCKEHAQRAEIYMQRHNYRKASIVLSHDDSDHFDGIEYLIEHGLINKVYTLLLLKYKNELLDLIDDKRRTRESVAKRIEELYDHIYSLSGKVELKDIFTDINVSQDITIVGPNKEYALAAVAKNIDSRETDIIDKETIANAVSTQLSVVIDKNHNLLLTGDSSFKSIEEAIKTHKIIQLPHHGKLDQAESIFALKDNSTIYYVSDNTGDSNGGSDDLREKYPRGHIIYYTLNGDQVCAECTIPITYPKSCYFRSK
ncbi:MAG: hypothetical protein E7383_01185 [Ruminococcaceae bacterium]|nr:hypothetical protein [Oscillospiraceae bacterium]